MKKEDMTLFQKQSVNSPDFVVLNWHGKPINQFGLYAEAYHCAAKKLFKNFGSTGALRDFEAAPVLFLYRHAFELYLKAFILVGSKILRMKGKATMTAKSIFTTHELSKFLPHLESILEEVGWSWDMGVPGLRDKEEVVALIIDFESIDPGSFAFRYPTDIKGEANLPDHFSFNLKIFTERIDPLLAALDGALLGLEEYYDAAAEAAYEARQNGYY